MLDMVDFCRPVHIYLRIYVKPKPLQDLSQYQLLVMQLEASKALLEEKMIKEKQKYSDLRGKYEELQSSKSLSGEVESLKQKVVKEKQNYSDLLKKYEDLQNSLSLGTEAQTVGLEKIEVIKKYWGDKVCTTLIIVDKQITTIY